MDALSQVQVWLLIVLQVGAVLLELLALAHALKVRADYFVAVDRLTRPIWLVLLGAALALGVISIGKAGFFFVIPVMAAAIYLADVKPRIDEARG